MKKISSIQLTTQVMKFSIARKVSKYGVFWFVFSRIRTEYREILRISAYSVRMRENTDQKKLRI